MDQYVEYGFCLSKELARNFGITGRRNDIVLGRYTSTLKHPHPNPLVHLINFILHQRTHVSQLQSALGVPSTGLLQDPLFLDDGNITGNFPVSCLPVIPNHDFLRRVLNCVMTSIVAGASGLKAVTIHETVQSKPVLDASITIPIGNVPSGSPAKIDDLCGLPTKIKKCKRDRLRAVNDKLDLIFSKLQSSEPSVQVEPSVQQSEPSSSCEVSSIIPSSDGANAAESTSKRACSSSVQSPSPSVKVSSKKKLKSNGAHVTPGFYEQSCARDFGGATYPKVHLDSYEDYDSDYFEKFERPDSIGKRAEFTRAAASVYDSRNQMKSCSNVTGVKSRPPPSRKKK